MRDQQPISNQIPLPALSAMKIRLESYFDATVMELGEIAGDTTIWELKEIYCEDSEEDPECISLWWCGRDLPDDLEIKDDFGHRKGITTTFHVDFKTPEELSMVPLHEDREQKRRRTV